MTDVKIYAGTSPKDRTGSPSYLTERTGKVELLHCRVGTKEPCIGGCGYLCQSLYLNNGEHQ